MARKKSPAADGMLSRLWDRIGDLFTVRDLVWLVLPSSGGGAAFMTWLAAKVQTFSAFELGLIFCFLLMVFVCIWAIAGHARNKWAKKPDQNRHSSAAIDTKLEVNLRPRPNYPEIHRQTNIYEWYFLRFEMVTSDSNGNEITRAPWAVFVLFDEPAQYQQISVSVRDGATPRFNVRRSTPRHVVITIEEELPESGILTIEALK